MLKKVAVVSIIMIIKFYIKVYYIAVPAHSTGIPEATVYAGQVFYKPKNTMRFTAARDLNALRQVIIMTNSHLSCY